MTGRASLPVTVEIAFDTGPMDPTTGTTALTLSGPQALNYADDLNDVARSTVWTDVSRWVLRSRQITCSRGWDPFTGEPVAGRLSLVLRNDDKDYAGAFTPGATGPFGTMRNKLPIRIVRAGQPVWTGLIEKLAQSYDGGRRAIVTVTGVDRWARLKTRKITGDRVEFITQALDPENFWPLTDLVPQGRAESSSSGWALLPTPVAGVTAAAQPQAGLPDVAAMAFPTSLDMLWTGGGTPSPGMYDNGVTISAWVQPTTTTAVLIITIGQEDDADNYFSLEIGSSGVSTHEWGSHWAALPTSTAWRHIVVTAAQSGVTATLTVYADGAQVYTNTNVGVTSWVPLRTLRVQPASVTVNLGYLATFDRVLTAAEVQALHDARTDAFGQTGDTADVRAQRIAGLWPTLLTTRGTFASTMSKQQLSEVSQADLLMQAARTEAGTLYIDRDGWPVLQSRGWRSSVPLSVTIPASVISPDATWELDDQTQDVANVVTCERMALGETVTTINRRNQASIDDYDEVPVTVQVWLDSDTQAVARADAEVNLRAVPQPRARSFTIDLATCAQTVPVADILGVDVGDRIAVSGLPGTAPEGTLRGFMVDQIDDTLTHTGWQRTFTVTPALDYFTLDSPTLGLLDTPGIVLAY